jgi:hypothetical protein
LYLFKDTRFLELSWSERLTWLYLIGNSSKVRCPGLVEGSCLSIAQYLYWPLRVSESERFLAAVKDAEVSIRKLVAMGWLEHDLKAGVFFLPHAIRHNAPDNLNILWSWCKNLREYPSSPLTRRWIECALADVTTAFGREDSRYRLLAQISKGLKGADASNFQTKIEGFYDGYPDGTPDTLSSVVSAIRLETVREGERELKSIAKPTEMPSDFTPRQADLWRLLCSERFYVPGRGEQTVWDNVRDPVALCRKLGGDGFLLVDFGLIYRLAAWSFDQKVKAKRNLGAFLRACFARDQEQARKQPSLPTGSGVVLDAGSTPRPLDDTERAARRRALEEAGLLEGLGDDDAD